MKIVKYISAICFSLLVFSACDSDLDKVYYNESEVTPAVLSGIADTYVLDANKAQATAIANGPEREELRKCSNFILIYRRGTLCHNYKGFK